MVLLLWRAQPCGERLPELREVSVKTPQEIICPHCGALNYRDWSHCASCGRPLYA